MTSARHRTAPTARRLTPTRATRPRSSSDHLTVGTADSNGQVVRYEGHVRLNTIVGNPSTPGRRGRRRDRLLLQGRAHERARQLHRRAARRGAAADHRQGQHPQPGGAATTQDFTFDIDATCAIVSDPSPHSECQTTTTRRCPDPRSDQGRPALDLAAGSGGGLRRRARRGHRHRGQHGLRSAGALRSVGSVPRAEPCAEAAQNPLVHSAVTGAGADDARGGFYFARY